MATKTNDKHTHNGKRASTKKTKAKLAARSSDIYKVANQAKDTFIDVEESVEKYAKSHPWKTMGFSLLAGVVVAQLLHLHK